MKTKLMQLADNYATAVTERTIVGRVRSRAALEAEIDRVTAENERLREALKIAAASNAWQNFGWSRAFGGDFKTPAEVDAIARSALGETK